jgi:c-di-GMP-binding flagellar brake protein YcgR
MGLMALIFSHDERAVRMLRILLAELNVQVEYTAEFLRAQELLWCQKYDGVFAECDDEHGAALLRAVRKSKHNRRSIAFALSGTAVRMNSAFELGAHFVIQRPLAVEKVKRTLKAAHGLMMREQRSHYRHPTAVKVNLRTESGKTFSATLKDLSQSGALVDAEAVLRKDQSIHLMFMLPDTSIVIESEGKVTWSDPTGRAGIRFEIMPDASRKELLQWVIARSVEGEQANPLTMEVAGATANVAHTTAISNPAHSTLDLEVEIIEPEELEDVRLRTTLRGEHRAPLKLLAFEHGRPVIINGECANLSESGLAAELEEEIQIDDPVLLQVKLPGAATPLVMHAEFRYKEGVRYGFEFVGLSEKLQQLLRKSVKDLPVE